MLVISRKKDQSIVIGPQDGTEEILIVVGEIRGGTVKLCFKAGRDVPIYRSEIWQRVQNDHQDSTSSHAKHRKRMRSSQSEFRRQALTDGVSLRSDIAQVVCKLCTTEAPK
ncbi:MAG: carbon storage regulator [Pirellulales bacterium]